MAGAESPLHGVALEAVALVQPAEPGNASAIPPKQLSAFKKRLVAYLDQPLLFVHLCVLYVRLKTQGLTTAAEQMLELARIGLKPEELRRTVEGIDPLREAAQRLKAPVAGQPKGLKTSTQLGVGLRTQKVGTAKVKPPGKPTRP